MQSLLWYFNRLRRMSPAETAYRIRKIAGGYLERGGIGTVPKPPLPGLSRQAAGMAKLSIRSHDVRPYLSAADRLIAGRFDLFDMQDAEIGNPPEWNRDPKTGTLAPLGYGKSIDYRDNDLVGDIKYLWEPSRHHQLVTLAQAYSFSGDDTYLDALFGQIESWLDQCPYLQGVHWTSSLENAIRLINWSFVWQILGGQQSPVFQSERGKSLCTRWMESVYQHAHFISRNLSHYSSANNHLIGEVAGLFVASCTWPLWEEMSRWQAHSREILVREALLQNYDDGVNREQTTAYQHFVCDFLIVAGLAGRNSSVDFPNDYWDRIHAMLEFIASVMDMNGNIPMIGDADDGYVVKLSQEKNFCPFRSLLATGGMLFDDAYFCRKAGILDDKTRWLLHDPDEADFERLNDSSVSVKARKTTYTEGGYYIIEEKPGTEREVKAVIDAGPLGYLSIAAHGHADALALYLCLAGHEFLIDPGTYSYHADKFWRDYFRSTAAHNTVQIDQLDQSASGGNFMWTRHAHAECTSWQENSAVVTFYGMHDGYTCLPDPVKHFRKLEFDRLESRFLVQDEFECKATHRVDRYWHFSEHCTVETTKNSIIAVNGNVRMRVVFPPSDSIELVRLEGSTEPPGGWVSRSFGRKSPAVTIVCSQTIQGTARLSAEIECFA